LTLSWFISVAAFVRLSEKSKFDGNAMSRVITRLTIQLRYNALA
jgi:cyclophilin family peptidyl-prolyl cis-trans isomerase